MMINSEAPISKANYSDYNDEPQYEEDLNLEQYRNESALTTQQNRHRQTMSFSPIDNSSIDIPKTRNEVDPMIVQQ